MYKRNSSEQLLVFFFVVWYIQCIEQVFAVSTLP